MTIPDNRKILGTVIAIEGSKLTVHVPAISRRINEDGSEETDEEFRERLRSMFERPSEEQT